MIYHYRYGLSVWSICSTADELLATELIFTNAFDGMTPEVVVGVLGALVEGTEKAKSGGGAGGGGGGGKGGGKGGGGGGS